MAKSVSYEDMTLEQLQGKLNELMLRSSEISQEKRLVTGFIDRKLSEERVKKLVENMSESDKIALNQIIGVKVANSVAEGNNN